jgi:hypothetical protein
MLFALAKKLNQMQYQTHESLKRFQCNEKIDSFSEIFSVEHIPLAYTSITLKAVFVFFTEIAA